MNPMGRPTWKVVLIAMGISTLLPLQIRKAWIEEIQEGALWWLQVCWVVADFEESVRCRQRRLGSLV
ncbi:MAG: hypothetical protein ACKO25_12275 [Cyanobium sp.]